MRVAEGDVAEGDVAERDVAADVVEQHTEPLGALTLGGEVAGDVLFVIDHGTVDPPPDRVTFLPTVMPLSRTAAELVAVMLPWTVIVEWPSGSPSHG